MNRYIVITTINEKSYGIEQFEQMDGWNIVIIGDKNSRKIHSSGNLIFLSIEDQEKLGYEFVKVCPYNHYTRKNIGYLFALRNNADIIYDTDDDNIPHARWNLHDFICEKKISSDNKFINIYKYFYNGSIWPRGFPLDEVAQDGKNIVTDVKPVRIGAWQGLADSDPDVDAVYRLFFNKTITFENRPAIALEKNNYCPINSQNTFWNKKFFECLYLPSTVSFRFTDILRGYVAQRLFWSSDHHVGFTDATVYQQRNAHDLMKDFKDEVECYLNTKPIVALLDSLELGSDVLKNLELVYSKLLEKGYVENQELNLLKAWMSDFTRNK